MWRWGVRKHRKETLQRSPAEEKRDDTAQHHVMIQPFGESRPSHDHCSPNAVIFFLHSATAEETLLTQAWKTLLDPEFSTSPWPCGWHAIVGL
jgi:hypothetical protein